MGDKMTARKQYTQNGRKYTSGRQLVLGAGILVLIFYVIVHIPSYISYRNKKFCTKAESEAKVVASALVDYFSEPNNKTTPTFDQLRKWSSLNLSGENTVTIIGPDSNDQIIVMVTDSSGKCPEAYQEANIDGDDIGTGWIGKDVYKFTISKP